MLYLYLQVIYTLKISTVQGTKYYYELARIYCTNTSTKTQDSKYIYRTSPLPSIFLSFLLPIRSLIRSRIQNKYGKAKGRFGIRTSLGARLEGYGLFVRPKKNSPIRSYELNTGKQRASKVCRNKF
jgi:hypothetical protein